MGPPRWCPKQYLLEKLPSEFFLAELLAVCHVWWGWQEGKVLCCTLPVAARYQVLVLASGTSEPLGHVCVWARPLKIPRGASSAGLLPRSEWMNFPSRSLGRRQVIFGSLRVIHVSSVLVVGGLLYTSYKG